MIEDWLSGAAANEGLVVLQQSSGSAIQFVSRGLGGNNLLGPRLEVETQLGEPGSPVQLSVTGAAEDTFLPVDRDPFEAGGLTVAAGDPVSRAIFIPNFDQVPANAAIVDVKFIVSIDEARIPGDSLRFLANQVLSDFLGEKTILAPATASSILGLTTLSRDSLPVDSLVFQSNRLRDLVRRWLREPGMNRGLALTVLEEASGFGKVKLFDPSAVVQLRPRLRLVVLPGSNPGFRKTSFRSRTRLFWLEPPGPVSTFRCWVRTPQSRMPNCRTALTTLFFRWVRRCFRRGLTRCFRSATIS
ncbi:MAG: hypothetical protein P8Y29_05385 [Gemmatimonadota bacterium]